MSSAQSRRGFMTGGLAASAAGLIAMAAPTFPMPWAGSEGATGEHLLSWFSPTLLGNAVFLALPAALAALAAVVLGFLKWNSDGQRFLWAPAIWSFVAAVIAIIALLVAGAVNIWAGLAIAALVVAAGLWTQVAKPALPDALDTRDR